MTKKVDNDTAVGTRVLAITQADKAKVYVLGAGVYEGDCIPPLELTGLPGLLANMLNIPTPRIKLDSGEIVYGCECYWGEEDRMRRWIGKRQVVMTSIQEYREASEELQEAVEEERKKEDGYDAHTSWIE